MILLDWSHDFWENEVLFVKIDARVLDLCTDTSSWPKRPECSFEVPGPKVKTFFQISWFYWIHLIVLEKMKSCLWKLELEFSNNGLRSPLSKALVPNCTKLVFWPQIPNVRVLGAKIFFMSSSIKFSIK